MSELWSLLGVGLSNMAYRTVLDIREAARYAADPRWWRLRMAFWRVWGRRTPLSVVRREGPATGLSEDQLIYGETPCLTLDRVAAAVQLQPSDVFVDLGAGRGVPAAWMALRHGVRSHGIEVLPGFVQGARRLASLLHIPSTFIEGDVTSVDWPSGTVFYVPWTTWPPATIRYIASRLRTQPAGTRLITLTEPPPSPGFIHQAHFRADFTWGPSEVYIQVRI